jgi:phage I-like protein
MKAGTLKSATNTKKSKRTVCQIEPIPVDLVESKAPEWVELIPAGREIRGRDGRTFTNSNPSAVIQAFEKNKADLPLDWEHSSEYKAPNGEPAPAAGWIVALEVRQGGAIWGKVDWTDRGASDVISRAYRYLSPVFIHDEKKNIIALLSAGLTNQPNLHLTALNQITNEERDNVMLEKLIALLGLATTATEDEIMAALNAQKKTIETHAKQVEDLTTELNVAKAKNSVVPQLDKYVPRADYELVLNRAKQAEDKLTAHEKAQIDANIEIEIQKATEAGKITPATVEYHRAQCHQEGGLERFKQFVKDAPVVAAAINSGLDNRQPSTISELPLTEDQKKLCRDMGITEEQFKNTK